MKLGSRIREFFALLRGVRRVAVALERLVVLYEADLASRGVVVLDPRAVGDPESRVEVSYGVTEHPPEGEVLSFDEFLR